MNQRQQYLPLPNQKPYLAARRPPRRLWRGLPCSVLLLRSEEHTSELQSRFDLVCRLLLEKKNMIGQGSTAYLLLMHMQRVYCVDDFAMLRALGLMHGTI